MHLLNCCNFPEKEAPQSYVHNAKCKEKCQSAAQWNQMGRLRSMKAPKFAAVVERNVLRRLHPVGPAIKSFPCGSSGGISGWRASHFKATHWYLDDGVLCGKAEDIKKALELLQNYCAEIGLKLNFRSMPRQSPAPQPSISTWSMPTSILLWPVCQVAAAVWVSEIPISSMAPPFWLLILVTPAKRRVTSPFGLNSAMLGILLCSFWY